MGVTCAPIASQQLARAKLAVQREQTGAVDGRFGAASRKVLLVDDDAPLRRNLARAFERDGFEVATAASLKEAYHVAADFCPDFALLDLGGRLAALGLVLSLAAAAEPGARGCRLGCERETGSVPGSREHDAGGARTGGGAEVVFSHAQVVFGRDSGCGSVFGRDGGLTKVDLLERQVARRSCRWATRSVGRSATTVG